jgi:zinc transporter ZupT
VLLCASAGAILGLRVRHHSRDLLTMKYASGFVTIVGGLAVAFATRSTIAIARLTALAALVGAAVGWFLLMRSRPMPVEGPSMPVEVA